MTKEQGQGSHGGGGAWFDLKAAGFWQESAGIVQTALPVYLCRHRGGRGRSHPPAASRVAHVGPREKIDTVCMENRTTGAIFLAFLPACVITKEKKAQ